MNDNTEVILRVGLVVLVALTVWFALPPVIWAFELWSHYWR
jgi:hypothetical protein